MVMAEVVRIGPRSVAMRPVPAPPVPADAGWRAGAAGAGAGSGGRGGAVGAASAGRSRPGSGRGSRPVCRAATVDERTRTGIGCLCDTSMIAPR